MDRIVVVGTSGSGKTTLAQQLANKLSFKHVELDALHWEANWQMAELEVFRERVTNALIGDQWVVDGNYSKVRPVIWARADTIIWLDYPLYLILWRMIKRILRRTLTRENLWGTGNRETLWKHLFTRESLILWVLQTYRRRKREYPLLFRQPEYAHLNIIHFCSPRKVDKWVSGLG